MPSTNPAFGPAPMALRLPDTGEAAFRQGAAGHRPPATGAAADRRGSPMPDACLLRRSFQHLPGISVAEEARLWAEGISDWVDLIRHTPIQLDMYRKRGGALQSAVEASEEALANRDVAFFASRLPKREHYRIAASFPERCVFLDIESTGLSTYYDQVTLVGWSVDDTYTVLIDPGGIEALERDLREHPMIVTFNGSLFDLPFLARRFKKSWSGLLHVDLRYLGETGWPDRGAEEDRRGDRPRPGSIARRDHRGRSRCPVVRLQGRRSGRFARVDPLQPRGHRRHEVPVRGSGPPDCLPDWGGVRHERRSFPADRASVSRTHGVPTARTSYRSPPTAATSGRD